MSRLLALLLLPVLLTACGTVRETLGIEGSSGPDEFDVATAPPLAIPPDFTLRPPEPGAARPQAVNPADTARELLTGSAATASSDDTVNVPAASNVEDSLVSNLGTKSTTGPAAAPISAVEQLDVLDETAKAKAALEAPVTRNEPGKLPTIEMQSDDGNFWDSWF